MAYFAEGVIMFIIGVRGPGPEGVVGSLLADELFHVFHQDPGRGSGG